MSDHLPECPLFRPCRGNANGEHIPQGTIAGIPVTICGMCMHDCICPALRACTVRVLGEAAKVVEDAHHCPPPDIVLATDGGIHCLSVTHDQWLKDLRAIDRLAQEAP